MRLVLLLLLMITPTFSADLVTLRTKDGRSMTGYYDAEEGTLTTIKPKGMFRIKAHEIASVTPVAAPEQTAATADNSDLLGLLKRRYSGLEADRDKALAKAKRHRMATKAKDPKDAKTMEAIAASSDAEALGYQKEMDAMAIKLAELESDKKAIEVVEKKPQLSEIGRLRLHLQELKDRAEKTHAETQETTKKLNELTDEASWDFILTGDLEPVAIEANTRPNPEENNKILRISQFNAKLETLRGLREERKRSGTKNHRNNWGFGSADRFMGSNRPDSESFWSDYAEYKHKSAPY